MSKSDVTQEQMLVLADRLCQELGIHRKDTAGFFQFIGPTTKHRLYVQKSQTLNRIDFTIDLPSDDPMYKQLGTPNGSIKCHIVPTLENVERALRMLVDTSVGTQVPNKPRPFAATKAPAPRKPKPLAEPVPEARLEPVPPGGSLKDRLAKIHASARKARIRRILENPEQYGTLSEDEAAEIVDGKAKPEEVKELADASAAAELSQLVEETGIQLDMN